MCSRSGRTFSVEIVHNSPGKFVHSRYGKTKLIYRGFEVSD